MHSADRNPARIRKVDRSFGEELDFEDITFPVKSKDIQKFGKKYSIGINVFSYENKVKYLIHVSKICFEEKHIDEVKLHKRLTNQMCVLDLSNA